MPLKGNADFLSIFVLFFGQLGGEKIITKICAGNGETKNTQITKQMQNDSWCRIRKVLTWGHAENIRGARPKLAKKAKVAFRCRWFIAVYLVTSGVAFHLHRPVAPALTWTRKRPRRAPEFVPFPGLRGKRNSFAISILYVAIWGKSVKGKNKYFSIW